MPESGWDASNDGKSTASFNLTIEIPVKLTFTDGRSNVTEPQILAKNGTASLSCHVYGNPQPEIYWIWDVADLSGQPRFESQSNMTMRVFQPGIYECIAKNRFGSNFRRFPVDYEKEPSYLAYIIAIPASIIFVTLVALLLVGLWYKRAKVSRFLQFFSVLLKLHLFSDFFQKN